MNNTEQAGERWAFGKIGSEAVCQRPKCRKTFIVTYLRRGYCSNRCRLIVKREKYNKKRRLRPSRVWHGQPIRSHFQNDFFENAMSVVSLRALQSPSFILEGYPEHAGRRKERLPYPEPQF